MAVAHCGQVDPTQESWIWQDDAIDAILYCIKYYVKSTCSGGLLLEGRWLVSFLLTSLVLPSCTIHFDLV